MRNDFNIDAPELTIYVGPIIRYLCGRWIFREVTPDVFTNNRLSSVLDKGKSVAELQKR